MSGIKRISVTCIVVGDEAAALAWMEGVVETAGCLARSGKLALIGGQTDINEYTTEETSDSSNQKT